ncbi:MAG TPA: hypothetical protein VM366_13860 [Anaerolineae bacterium]|nr:hypothetical protein [Anaerolineae bacterium]
MPDIWISLLTIFILGLFIGTNLGVLLMCLMRMTSPDPAPEADLAHMPVKDRIP